MPLMIKIGIKSFGYIYNLAMASRSLIFACKISKLFLTILIYLILTYLKKKEKNMIMVISDFDVSNFKCRDIFERQGVNVKRLIARRKICFNMKES